MLQPCCILKGTLADSKAVVVGKIAIDMVGIANFK